MNQRFFLTCIAIATLVKAPAIYSLESQPIVNYEVLFSPEDRVADKLIALINQEKKSIKAAVYCLMHRGIVAALIEAHKRGVSVEVIVDSYSLKSRSPVKKMGTENLSVFVWNPSEQVKVSKTGKKVKQRKSLMHDKFCILGESKVWTGSFNFTFEATQNNKENVIILENAEVAQRYISEFENLKKQGCVPLSEYLVPAASH